MARLQKTSQEKSVGIFDALLNQHVPLKDRQPDMKQPKADKVRDRSWEKTSAHASLTHNNIDGVDLGRNGHSIRSAACGDDGITNMGGSGRFVGANKSCSMSSNVLDKISQIMTAKEATLEEKRASKSVRKTQQSEFREANSPKIGDDYAPQKGSNIASNHTKMANGYTPGLGKMSIFDNKDFERVQDLPGEKMEKRQAKKDDSWKEIKKAQTMQDAGGKFFDAISDKPQESGYKSSHKSTVDRLFSALAKTPSKKEE